MDNTTAMAGSDILQGAGVSVHAGFPNPAADRHGSPLKLDQLLISHPSSSYLFRIVGDSNEGEGIFEGDIAIVDRALSPRPRDYVISWQGEQFVIQRFAKATIEPWGVISAIIHQYRP